MRKIIILSIFSSLILNSCKEAKEKINTSFVEKSIETLTGQKVDILDLNSLEKSRVEFNLESDELNVKDLLQKSKANIVGTKDGISITINNEEEKSKNIIMGFTGKDFTQNKPIHAAYKNGFSFAVSKIENNNFDIKTIQQGSGEILEFKENKLVLKLDIKIANAQDTDKPEKWKDLKGTITLFDPIFQTMGCKKEDLIY